MMNLEASLRNSNPIQELLAIAEQELEERKGRDEIVRLCSERTVSHKSGPMYWLRNWTKTENYHWEKQGLQPKQPFPYKPYPPELLASYNVPPERMDWDYLDWVMHYLLLSYETGKPLNIPKTREMITSWLVMGYIAWSTQFFPNVQALGQSEKDEKAQGLVKYANTLHDNQPEWMKARFPLKRGEAGTAHKIQRANGSEFIGVPQGERQVASYHPTIYFNDESAHQPAFKATVNIVKPVAKQIICVSSAAISDFGIECDPSKAV